MPRYAELLVVSASGLESLMSSYTARLSVPHTYYIYWIDQAIEAYGDVERSRYKRLRSRG